MFIVYKHILAFLLKSTKFWLNFLFDLSLTKVLYNISKLIIKLNFSLAATKLEEALIFVAFGMGFGMLNMYL